MIAKDNLKMAELQFVTFKSQAFSNTLNGKQKKGRISQVFVVLCEHGLYFIWWFWCVASIGSLEKIVEAFGSFAS